MDLSLLSYCKVYKNVFDTLFCHSLIKQIEKESWQTHEFAHYDPHNRTQYENELSVNYAKFPEKEILQEKLWHTIKQYIIDDLQSSVYTGWNGYTEIRFNKYIVGKEMHEHCDHIHSMFDGIRKGIPTLSIVGLLNEDYEGGEFVMWKDIVIDIPCGSVLIFPSNFLYPHKVTPVTKGIRYSFVSWVW